MTEQEKIKRAHQKVNKLLDEIPNSETLKNNLTIIVCSIDISICCNSVCICLMYHYFKTHNEGLATKT